MELACSLEELYCGTVKRMKIRCAAAAFHPVVAKGYQC
jgi:hypothetical protein